MASALLTGGSVGATISPSTTGYFALGVGTANAAGVATETSAQQIIETGGTYSNLSIYITANSLTAASTLKFRVNGANGNQSVSIGAGATGWFTDASDTDVCLASQAFLMVSNIGGGYASKLTLGGAVSNYSTIAGAIGSAIDANGNVFVSTWTNNTIIKIAPSGVQSTFASGLNTADGLCFDASGNLYEADSGSGNIYKFTPSGTKTTFISGLTSPASIVFDVSGNAYVSVGAGTIYKYNSSGGSQTTFATGLSAPQQMVFDSLGNMYVANYSGNTISKITSGGVVTTFASGLNNPQGLTIDPNGNLYEVDRGTNTINLFTLGGAKSTFASSGFNGPCSIAYGTLPSYVDVQLITGGTGTSLTFRNIEGVFLANTGTSYTTACFNSISFSTASLTDYVSWSTSGVNTTESFEQYKMQTPATAKNLCVVVTANSRSTTDTVQSRKNGGNGNLSVSIGASATGTFQDLSDSDSLAAGDLTNWEFVTGTGTGTVTLSLVTCDFQTTNNESSIFGAGGSTEVTSSTTYFFFGCQPNNANSNEANVQSKALVPLTASKMQLLIGTNTISATSTANFRKNATNGNQSLSIGSLATGWFTDASDTDALAATDIFDLQLIAGGTGTSIKPNGIGVTMTSGSSKLLAILGVG